MNKGFNLHIDRVMDFFNLCNGELSGRHNPVCTKTLCCLRSVYTGNGHLSAGMKPELWEFPPYKIPDTKILNDQCIHSRLIRGKKIIIQLPLHLRFL